MSWFNFESNETMEKLMKEYQLTLEEYLEVTKPPICILPRRDPITGIRKFPEHKELTEEEIEKYKREDIERNYGFAINKLSIKTVKEYLKERYNILTEELLFAISGATSNLKYKPPIRIRRDWSLMVEAYLRGKKEKEKFLKNKRTKYATGVDVNGINISAQDLSIESFEKKVGVEHKKAVKFMNIINKGFIITPKGLKTKENDPVLKYIEPVVILRSEKYEKTYERAIPIIKEMAMNGEKKLSTYTLARKLKVSFKTIGIILKMLNEMRVIEYFYGEVHPRIL